MTNPIARIIRHQDSGTRLTLWCRLCWELLPPQVDGHVLDQAHTRMRVGQYYGVKSSIYWHRFNQHYR